MATDKTDDEPGEPGDVPPATGGTGKSKKKRIILIAAAASFVLIGSGGGAYALFGGHAKPAEGKDKTAGKAEASAGKGEGETFIDVPPMIVNLRSADGAPRFIKLHFMLVPGPSADVEELKKKIPLVLDAYQPFLRELRPEDLAGSAAVFRIKEEMLLRATATLGPDEVTDVLIQDLIQQ